MLAGAGVLLFVSLGHWQWQRGIERRAQWQNFDSAGETLPSGSRDLAALPRFARVALEGRYDAAQQFLLDNRTREGRAGYEVLTPFILADGRVVLVNRGWLPFSGYRERLPDVAFEAPARLTVSGRVDRLPSPGLPQGRAAPQSRDWPRITSFPDMGQLSSAYGRELEPRIVLLDQDAPHGYVRNWRPPGVEPARHFSYAVQWWAFAVLAGVFWMVLGFRRGAA